VNSSTTLPDAPERAVAPASAPVPRRSPFADLLGPKRIGAVYVWVVIAIVLVLLKPDTILTSSTLTQILNNSAITGLAALALLVPLAARTFDLSIGFVMSLAGVTTAHFCATGMGVLPAILLGIAAALAVGLINATVVVLMRVDSFIGTLATGSIVAAFITMVTKEQDITDVKLTGGFSKIGQTDIGGVTLPVLYALIVAVLLWVFLEKTTTGRRIYSVGFNPEAAKLAGIRSDRLRFASLICSAGIAGVAGIALASTIGAGSPSAGQSYLLPAFAAAFLGATQLRPGRFNSMGTVIAVLVLTTGTTGLALVLAPAWAADLFTGVVLIAALTITGAERRGLRGAKGSFAALRARFRGAGA
jgi:ribose transport system permease protein